MPSQHFLFTATRQDNKEAEKVVSDDVRPVEARDSNGRFLIYLFAHKAKVFGFKKKYQQNLIFLLQTFQLTIPLVK